MNPRITLILGGARSGKSSFAEQLATMSKEKITYLATAEAKDSEMEARILIHKKRRPIEWDTWEGNYKELPSAISSLSGVLLLDCLTMWLTKLFLENDISETVDEGTWMTREEEIKNLTEKRYNEYGVYSSFANDIGLYPSPGRQFFFSIQYAFGG